ncbi:hypothetical protein TgHK011_007761 [Trichoderma gracile]|nr:hypothetical protein TgHK011_007761 [Trichoderma gracile]
MAQMAVLVGFACFMTDAPFIYDYDTVPRSCLGTLGISALRISKGRQNIITTTDSPALISAKGLVRSAH